MATTNPDRLIAGSEDISSVYQRYGKLDFLASLVGVFVGFGTLLILFLILIP